MTFVALVWNLYLAGVLFSPIEFPVTSDTFNCQFVLRRVYASSADFLEDSPVIFGVITFFGILTWWLTPEDKWLPAARLGKVHQLDQEEFIG